MSGELDRLVDVLADVVVDRVVARVEPLLDAQAAEPWRLLDVGEAAAMLGRSRSWVQKATRPLDAGGRGLPHVRLDGGGLMFDPDDLRAFALARRVPAAHGDLRADRVQPARDAAPSNGSRAASRSGKPKAGRR